MCGPKPIANSLCVGTPVYPGESLPGSPLPLAGYVRKSLPRITQQQLVEAIEQTVYDIIVGERSMNSHELEMVRWAKEIVDPDTRWNSDPESVPVPRVLFPDE